MIKTADGADKAIFEENLFSLRSKLGFVEKANL